MQKKLADYLQILLEHKDDALVEFYEPHALMMTDEVRSCFGTLFQKSKIIKKIFLGNSHLWNSHWIECY